MAVIARYEHETLQDRKKTTRTITGKMDYASFGMKANLMSEKLKKNTLEQKKSEEIKIRSTIRFKHLRLFASTEVVG